MRELLIAASFLAAGPNPASAQDVTAGETVFAVCKACHQVGDNAKNAIGPTLNGLFGRRAGVVTGYSYSEANRKSGLTWTDAAFSEYIKDPRAKIPGTKKIFAGIKDERKIKDLIAYLHTFDRTGSNDTGAEISPPISRRVE
jgi:cytochrome c